MNGVKEISITLQEQDKMPADDKRDDRFLVQVCFLESPTTDINEFWKVRLSAWPTCGGWAAARVSPS